MTKDELFLAARDLPATPGVYIMRNSADKVIYVGKSKALRNRVSQYFQGGSGHNEKTRRMVASVRSFEYVLTNSEIEALALENKLIKLDSGIMVDLDYEEIETYMRSSGAKIIKRKGSTNYAIAISVCGICECLYGGVNAVATLSTMLNGEYGIKDVCLSLPMIVGNGKIQGRITPRLTDEEVEKLHISANALKSVIKQVEF